MANAYISLTTSTAVAYRFRVVMGSRQRMQTKSQSRRRTANGKSDNTEGAVLKGWAMTLRVRNVDSGQDPDGAAYGVLDDLDTLFGYNNPNGSPTNQFTFTDHDGASYTVELVGQMPDEMVTPDFDGDEAWYYVPIMMEKVNA